MMVNMRVRKKDLEDTIEECKKVIVLRNNWINVMAF